MRELKLFISLILVVFAVSANATGSYDLLKKAELVKSKNFEEFKNILNQVEAGIEQGEPDEKAFYQYLVGYEQAILGNNKKAIDKYNLAVNIAESNEVKFKSQMALANLQGAIGLYTEALTSLNEGLEYFSRIDNDEDRGWGLLNAGVIYNLLGQHELAKNSARSAIDILKGHRNICMARHIELEALLNLKEIQVDEMEKSVYFESCEKKNEVITKNLMNSYISKALKSINKIDEGIKLLEDNFPDVKTTGYKNLIALFHARLSELYFEKNDMSKAVFHASSSLKNSVSSTSNIEWIISSYEILYKVTERTGNYQEALGYHKELMIAHKIYAEDLSQRRLAFELVTQQTNEKSRQIELLNKQNEVLKLEQDLARKEVNNNRLMVLLLIFFLASLAFWTYRVKRNQIKLKRQSETDLLTGVCSRHHFYFMSRKTLEYASNTNQEVSFVLFDLDKFKSVNDNYGHLVGDWVLKKIIEACRPCWRQNDIAGRLGGEEFSLMLPTCDLEKAVEIAEKCRQAIEAIDTTESGHKFNISASFGVTTSKVSGYSLQDLIGDADRVMYQAKAAGKNQVLQVTDKS